MASRFSSGSVIPFRDEKNSLRASTMRTVTPSFRKTPATWPASPSRIRPLSMKTVSSRLPKALCPSIVTVDESTPPDRALIASLGGMYSRELGIDPSRGDSGKIFRWFLACKLMGARISTRNALGTYKEFERRGVVTPGRIRQTGWDGLVEILDAGGYARYDFSTATN